MPKFKDQIKVQTDKAKARHEKFQHNLVVRGITFSNMVQNKTEKVQSVLAEKIQINKRETELELGNIVQKLETKLEESFKALSEKVVSFMSRVKERGLAQKATCWWLFGVVLGCVEAVGAIGWRWWRLESDFDNNG